jgi:UDP-N-acetyl-2-amino-2-deoxyglucuronate dehydrogenase
MAVRRAVKRAAIIGCGDVSVIHREAIGAIDGIELVGVCDTDPARLADASAAAGVPGYASVAALLDAGVADVVHVTTPHDQHVTPTLACLAAGVHVIQEKPLAAHLADAQRLVDAAPTASAKVGICFQNRYNVSSQQLRRLLDSGELGAVRGAYSSVVWTRSPDYYVAKPWRGSAERSGGGLLINQAIHTLDLLQWFLGDVVEVTGHVSTDKFGDLIEVEDTAQLLLTHAGGVTTSFYATLTAPRHRPVEIELDCENAYVTLRDGLTVDWSDGRPAEQYPERVVSSAGRSYWGVSHEILIRDFYKRLDDPEPFWISPAEAMKSLRVLKRAYEVSS